MVYMRAQFTRIFGSIIALLVLGAICITGLRAQQTARSSKSSTKTTNWVGNLVIGQPDLSDRITSMPSPEVNRQVEIGLRSDGVVIWRDASKTK